MNSRTYILLLFLFPISVFSQKKLKSDTIFNSSKIFYLEIDKDLNEELARTIDLVLASKLNNVYFSVTDETSNTCVMIVSEKFSKKYSDLDSISISFKKITGFGVKDYKVEDFSKEKYFSIYKTVKYFYENHEPEGEDAPKCYRTGNVEKDQLNYNFAYSIWKETKQNVNN